MVHLSPFTYRFSKPDKNLLESLAWKGLPGHASIIESESYTWNTPARALDWHSTEKPIAGDWLLLRWHGMTVTSLHKFIDHAFDLCEGLAEHRLVFAVPSHNENVQLFALLHNAAIDSTAQKDALRICNIDADVYHNSLTDVEASRIVDMFRQTTVFDFKAESCLFSLFDSQSDNYVSLTLICDDGTIYRQ